MAKTWEEVKAICDDPGVSPEAKQALLSSWMLTEEAGDAPEEVGRYYDAFGAYPMLARNDVDEVYNDAKQEADQASYNEREQGKLVDDGKADLERAQPPTPSGGGTETSDELFDAAEPALRVFRNFGPLLGMLPGDCVGRTRPLDFGSDIQKRFDEQRGISFAEFMADAERFGKGAATVDTTMQDTAAQLNTLFQNWSGDAANAAYDHYTEKIDPKAKQLSTYLTDAEEATKVAAEAVYRLCKGKADSVMQLDTTLVGRADRPMAEKVIKLANGEAAGKEEMADVAGWMDVNFGTNMTEKLNDDGCCDDDEIIEEGKKLAKQWIQNQFNPDMWDRLYKGFETICDDTKELVNNAYDQLDGVMSDIENEFQGMGEQQPFQPPPPGPGPGDSGGGGNGGGGGGIGGGGGPGGGIGAGGGGGTTPSVSEPPETGQTDPGTNPVTGKPLEVDPETGKPYPIDPETGEAIKDAGDDQDNVTVEQGDHKISMEEPDDKGRMGISVDDGSGTPKEYKLDFGTGPEGEPGAGAEPGEFGPEGSGTGDGTGGEQVYRPGPDGKIHIEDGNLKITAEQPEGPDGPTMITIDDGSGEPTVYTLGEESEEPGPDGELKPDEIRGGPEPLRGEDIRARTDGPPPGGEGTGVPGGDGASMGGGTPVAAGPAEANVDADLAGASGGSGGSAGVPAGGEPSTGDAAGTEPQAVGGGVAAGAVSGGGGVSALGGGLDESSAMNAGAQSGASAQPAGAGAGLGSAPGGLGESPAAASSGQSSAMGGAGMGMMGGGMGGAGGQGGDQERGGNQYRIDGGIFETSGGGGRISGSLDEDGDRSIRFDR
ncbi:WXG100 family type VII secretion target [Amycolatopsis aidingensis]|uniref:WXG100 family type VII secretion target n=1 Tax=Amycolatopsis aidingensis TaxID=2842453 RepID=UPI001C0E13B0|nr:WXG100 family type VII secretion target [Amycolatopsis aidingensis]